jgi:hypothetical protein
MNGQDGAQGGPTFTGRQQPVSGDWWVWGYLPGEAPDGTLNANGSLNASQQAVWSQLLPTSVASVACFMTGTQIRTPTGKSAVEDLNIGDLVDVYKKSPMKVRWIGVRNYCIKDVFKNPALRPIRIIAHAIEYKVPSCDLLISSKHAILINGSLIPVECLLNGYSIDRDYADHDIRYYHIELDTHEIIFANDLLVESYIDHNNRKGFDNYDCFSDDYCGNKIAIDNECYRRVNNGIAILRASYNISCKYAGKKQEIDHLVKINIDELCVDFVRGWAFHVNDPEIPLYLCAFDGDQVLGCTVAFEERFDVYDANAGPLNSGFRIDFVKKIGHVSNLVVKQYIS